MSANLLPLLWMAPALLLLAGLALLLIRRRGTKYS